MTGDDVALHPIVAELAAAMVRSPDKTSVSLPPAAVERALGLIRASTDQTVVRDLIALAVKVRRVAGDGGLAVTVALGLLVADKLGSSAAAADRFAGAGLGKDAAALLGTASESRGPRVEKPAAPAVKPKRGLSR